MTAVEVGRRELRLYPDPSRVIARMFVPGQEGFDEEDARVTAVVKRVLALPEEDVARALDSVVSRFEGRHHDLIALFDRHAEALADRLDAGPVLSEPRRLLLGATFTSEYAIEGAALCNPSIVLHPDQAGVAAGGARFVMSVRGIGEGHRSSIGFRAGVVDAAGGVALDQPPSYATLGRHTHADLDAGPLRVELARVGEVGENADFVLDALGDRFARATLEARLQELGARRTARTRAERTIATIRAVADRSYGSTFSPGSPLGERVLWPATHAESHGLEDARFVRFTHDDGRVSYLATYTAYDGHRITQQLLETDDFESFTSAPIVGSAAANKGLAVFPRRVRGAYAALSRCDRETNSIAFSDDLHHWPSSEPFQVPARSWELLQLGNCGSPIETAEGWLVLTHGVGPMRTYTIGAVLLDLDDPTRVIGSLEQPLLAPSTDERDGYVPNVVYSCGAMVHADRLVLPYGISDGAIGVATFPMVGILDALLARAA